MDVGVAGARGFATFGDAGNGRRGGGASEDGGASAAAADSPWGSADRLDPDDGGQPDLDEELFGSDWESDWDSDGDEDEDEDEADARRAARTDRIISSFDARAGLSLTKRERIMRRRDVREEMLDMEKEYLENQAEATGIYRKSGLTDIPASSSGSGKTSGLIDPNEYLSFMRQRRRALRQAGVDEPGVLPKELARLEKLPDDSFFTRLLEVGSSSVTRRGGRIQSFRALLVLGNARGSAGFGFGKGATIADAMQDATMKAYRDLVTIPLYEDRTLYHDVLGRHNNAKVMFRRARPGYGLKAGPTINAICDSFGLRDCVTKVYGSKNKYTIVHAAFKAFAKYTSMEQVALRRGQRLRDVNKLVEERYAEDLWKNWPDEMGAVEEVREGKGRKTSMAKKI